jgi:hypothetical protein
MAVTKLAERVGGWDGCKVVTKNRNPEKSRFDD